VTGLPASSPGGALTVEALEATGRPGARGLRFSGNGRGEVYLRHPQPLDLSRQSNGDLAVSLDVQVVEPPTAPVVLAMGCGEGCSGGVDIGGLLAELPAGEWRPLRVRLRCLAEAGTDMTRVDTPIRIATAGKLRLGVAGVELVSADGVSLTCPPRG
jgi:beta-glucosidase